MLHKPDQPSLLTLSPSQLSTHARPRHGVSLSHTERKNAAWVLPCCMSEHHGLLFNTDQCFSEEAASHSVPGHSPVQTGSVAEVEQQPLTEIFGRALGNSLLQATEMQG